MKTKAFHPLALGAALLAALAAALLAGWVALERGRPATPAGAVVRQRPPAPIAAWERVLEEFDRLGEAEAVEDLRRLAASAADGVALGNLAAAIELAARRAPSAAMQELVAQLLLRWAAIDPAAAAEHTARGLQLFLSEESTRTLFARVRAQDAGAAARLAAAMHQCSARNELVAQAVAGWAGADRAAALAWLEELPAGIIKVWGLEAVLRHSPPGAYGDIAACAATLPSEHVGFQREVVARWGELDPAGALAWAERLPDRGSREAVLPLALGRWAEVSPASAAGYLTAMPAGPARDQAAVLVASAWAQHDATGAVAWVAAFPDEALRQRAVERVLPAWIDADPASAAEWVARLPEGRLLDGGLAVLSRRLAPTYPQAAFGTATGIAAPELRWRQLERAARAWLASDPAAALAGIARSDLPEPAKIQLAALHRPESSP